MAYDFIGFTYNGKHCIKHFNIYRTSDGSRYNDDLVPSMNDKTADIPGGDGQYYFYTKHKTKQFSISIAFEHLTESLYREMREWLDGKGIHDLIFDEAPYKVYSAKVTGTPQLKTLCFDEKNESGAIERIYKGEGTIQFTCYYPYAHTPNATTKVHTSAANTNFGADGKILSNYSDTYCSNKNEWSATSELPTTLTSGMNVGDLPAPFKVTKSGSVSANSTFTVGNNSITVQEACTNLKWDSKTGLVLGTISGEERPIKYTGTSYGALPVADSNIVSINGGDLTYDFWYY